MKVQTKTILLDRQGVDEASAVIEDWLEAAEIPHRDVLRIRLTAEELLAAICGHGGEDLHAELRFGRWLGDWRLQIRYDGERFDPTAPRENEMHEWLAELLSRTGFMPTWRARGRENELQLRIPGGGHRGEIIMLVTFAAALLVGLLGQLLPEALKTGAADYLLSFLSQGFLNLLNTFIGVLIFLSIITGICGIGSAAAFGRIGKLMILRFVASTFLTCALLVLPVRLFFPLSGGGGDGSAQLHAILEMVFGILPSNPIRPFLEGNTLQIVFMAMLVGVVLLLTGKRAEGLRSLAVQAQAVVTRCVAAVCILLPVYVFSSLVLQFWNSDAGILLGLWKPLLVCALLCAALIGVYLAVVCRKLKVRASVLVPKLLPDFLIGLSTASASAAFAATMEINEKKLGIDAAYARTAVPVGSILLAGSFSLLFILTGVFLTEYYGLRADAAWWITLWVACALLAMATPPVSGGMISCLSILMLQLHIPQEGLGVGVTLALFLDFLCTSARIPILHLEMLLQAERLGLLDKEVLRSKAP